MQQPRRVLRHADMSGVGVVVLLLLASAAVAGCAGGVRVSDDDGGQTGSGTGGSSTGGQAGGTTGTGGGVGPAGTGGGGGSPAGGSGGTVTGAGGAVGPGTGGSGGSATGGAAGGSSGTGGAVVVGDGGVLLPTGVHIQYQCQDGNTGPATSVGINMIVKNDGYVPIDLKTFTIRYWLTTDSAPMLSVKCETIQPGVLSCAQVTMKVVPVTPARARADAYVEIGFTMGGVGYMGSISQLTMRLQANSPGFMQANDYSFDPTMTKLADYKKITAYADGTLLWGVEP